MTPRQPAKPPSDATHPDFVRWLVSTYADDFNGYRYDILGLKPAEWQDRVGDDLMQYRRVAVQSGHGIGKTTFGAAAIHWFLATRPNPAVVATANTETQLSTKLWRELAKLNSTARNGSWFDWTATRFGLKKDNMSFAAAIPWSENNAEAFAGTHEEHVLGVFDESSGIPAVIFTTFSGAMSTQGARWLALGNPTQNTGVFYEACNGKLRWRRPGDELLGKWRAHTIASWESPFVSPAWVNEQKFVLGEDSDDFRVRVAGLPPRTAADQLIPAVDLDHAVGNDKLEIYDRWPLILGVDVARQGTDRSIICARRGGYVYDRLLKFQGLTLKSLAHKVGEEVHYYREELGLETSAIFVEGGGSIGWGVIEELWELGYNQTQDVNPGGSASEPERFVNKRCEMWGYMKEWLETRRCRLPPDPDLREELLMVRRKPDAAMRLRLEGKDEIRRRLGKSTDVADALALTFAAPVELLAPKTVDRYGQKETYSPGDWMTA